MPSNQRRFGQRLRKVYERYVKTSRDGLAQSRRALRDQRAVPEEHIEEVQDAFIVTTRSIDEEFENLRWPAKRGSSLGRVRITSEITKESESADVRGAAFGRSQFERRRRQNGHERRELYQAMLAPKFSPRFARRIFREVLRHDRTYVRRVRSIR